MEPITLLVSAIIVLVGQGFKWLTKKFGIELGKALTLTLMFVLSIVGSLLYLAFSGQAEISLADWQTWLVIYGQAELWYTLIVKRLPFLQA